MSNPEQVGIVYDALSSVLIPYISTDDMGLNIKEATDPADRVISKLRELGIDEISLKAASAKALIDAADSLPGNYELPDEDEANPYPDIDNCEGFEQFAEKYIGRYYAPN